MLIISILLILSVGLTSIYAAKSNIENGTELLFTFVVFRHGDRTPVLHNMSFSDKPELMKQAAEKYGYGELTARGLQRGYQIGQFIRSRYSSLLSPQYNSSEVYIRSTDVTRCKMTVLTAMAAVYPPTEDNWSTDVNWTPVPYTTVDMADDYILAFSNCLKFIGQIYYYKPEIPQFKETLEKLSQITGIDIISAPEQVFTMYDEYACQRSLGLPLSDALEEMWPEIEKAASAVMESIFANEDYLALLSGVLLNEFFKAVSSLFHGEDTPRVRVYSGHDVTVFPIMAASRIKPEARRKVPKFGATFALELRKVMETGKYVVLPVYLPEPGESELQYLPIEGCDNLLCDFGHFSNITSKFRLEEDAWRTACEVNFTMPYWMRRVF